jgi:hypothetical protein
VSAKITLNQTKQIERGVLKNKPESDTRNRERCPTKNSELDTTNKESCPKKQP